MSSLDLPAVGRACRSTLCAALALILASLSPTSAAAAPHAWMSQAIVAEQARAGDHAGKEAVARRRARLLIAAMTLPQKLQQLTGSAPEILPELPDCYGARHIKSIPELGVPTFRVTNGPVGLGQNDCVSRAALEKQFGDIAKAPAGAAYTHPSSAAATALPSALGVAASFDPTVARQFGEIIADEMNGLALHVFEAPGVNLARLPILGRNFEYFGEDPYLSGVMATAETRAVQDKGVIAMLKHYVGNEQETNRTTIRAVIDQQTLRELYLLPFEMAIRDGKAAAVMCAYNYVNGQPSCENKHMLTDVLRKDWGFTGYVQSDFFAMKSTAGSLKAGMDNEMPTPLLWSAQKLQAALAAGEIALADIDLALERRYTQMFKAGIFDRPLVQTPLAVEANGRRAREIGAKSAVLLQNNGALPLRSDLRSVVLMGKASQVYAQQAVAGGALPGQPMGSGGGSSDVVPHYTVSPVDGLRQVLKTLGNTTAVVKLVLVDDENRTATIDGAAASFADALAQAAGADAVVMMAGTISEEGADRATFTAADGKVLAASAAVGAGLDWYAPKSNLLSTFDGRNATRNSNTVAMIRAVLAARSPEGRPLAEKSVLVLKDNAGPVLDQDLLGRGGPAILETWFPGQEDGAIVAELLFGVKSPSGRLPVTFPVAGRSFLDAATPAQFPGVPGGDGKFQVTDYAERLHIGYRWYDANVSGRCGLVGGKNPCIAFPFGHGLSYTTFRMGRPTLKREGAAYRATVTVANTGARSGAEVVQAYVSLPAAAHALGNRQPPKRLVGFEKIELQPGEEKTVSILIDPASSNHPLSVWSEGQRRWVVPPGEATVWVGRSSAPADLARAR